MNLAGLQSWGGLAGATRESAAAVVAGIPYDGSAVYRKGAAAAPARIRELSSVMPPVTEDAASLLGLAVDDIGDFDAGPSIESGWRAIAERLANIPPAAVLTVIGGDHCAAIPVLAAQVRRHPDLRVAWIDAHPDLCDFSRGGAWTCGCALRRALEVAAIDPDRVAFAGGRDYDLEEVKFIADHRQLMIGARELAADPEGAGRRLGRKLAGGPVHASFDIDVLDPAFAPGTEIPSAGGISTRAALDLLRGLGQEVELVGLDVMEVAPPLDHNDVTSLAALKLIFEFWGHAWKPPT
jgi:agmatinase